MTHVSLQPVPGYLQLSLYKENIRMDHRCGYIKHGGEIHKLAGYIHVSLQPVVPSGETGVTGILGVYYPWWLDRTA